jgi:hypothetical protein
MPRKFNREATKARSRPLLSAQLALFMYCTAACTISATIWNDMDVLAFEQTIMPPKSMVTTVTMMNTSGIVPLSPVPDMSAPAHGIDDSVPIPVPAAMPVEDLSFWTPMRALEAAAEFLSAPYREAIAIRNDRRG